MLVRGGCNYIRFRIDGKICGPCISASVYLLKDLLVSNLMDMLIRICLTIPKLVIIFYSYRIYLFIDIEFITVSNTEEIYIHIYIYIIYRELLLYLLTSYREY